MLKIVHHVCCGMDVHKKFVIAAIAFTDFKNVTTYKKKRFATFNSDLKSLEKWLLDNNCTEVCMESTGKYWIPIFNVLEKSCHVVVANPKLVSWSSNGQHKLFSAASFMTSLIVLRELCTLAAI